MGELVGVNVTYVQCDAEGCDYITNDVNNDTLYEYRNKACPDCGENLLTDADWQAFQGHLKVASVMSEFLKAYGAENPENEPLEKFAECELDGKGNTTIKFNSVNNGE